MLRLATALLIGVASACSGDGVTDPCMDEMSLAVGTGSTGFHPLGSGDPLQMVHGPQGGWHVDLSAAVGNTFQSVEVRSELTVPDIGTTPIAGGDEHVDFVGLVAYDELTCAGEVWSVQVLIDNFKPVNITRICGLHGKEAVFEVTVRDVQTDQAVTESVEVRLQASQQDLAFCAGGSQ
ncbi:MAG: hypothetical protein KTR31_13405 [Myxococcales bacterium]|nr:hypothetical protein [Myxococcales bacterium]